MQQNNYAKNAFPKKALLALMLILGWIEVSAQVDTEFWFVAPEITASHIDKPNLLRISTLGQAATVKVSMPANSNFSEKTISIAANSLSTLDLTGFKDMIENSEPDKISNKGLLITSTAPITAYYEVNAAGPGDCQCNADIFPLKGANALGTDFMVPLQTFWFNMTFAIPARSGFDIVATEDNTKVTITPSRAIIGHTSGSTFTVTLNRGQAYSAIAIGPNPDDHPAGSVVKSDKKIAITIKDDSMTSPEYGGCGDMMGEQLVPVSLAGKKYIVMKGFLVGPDRIFILATEDNTVIKISGVQETTINKGTTYMVKITAPSTFVETSKPAFVTHITGFGCEVGGSLLPPIECTGSSQVSFVRSTNESFSINIMVKKNGADGFKLNGNASAVPASIFSDVPGTNGEWVSTQLQTNLIGAGGAAQLTNSKEFFHMGIINGGASTGCRYGYFSSYSSFRLNAESNSPICLNGTIELKVKDAQATDVLQWTGPNNFKSAIANPVIPNVTANMAGTYIITGKREGCQSEPTELKVEILNNPVPKVEVSAPKTAICLGEAISFSAKQTSFPNGITPTYQWMVNGQVSGTNSNTFSSNTLKDKDKISIKVTFPGASAQCIPNNILSQEIEMAVASANPPTVALEAISSTGCTGDTLAFTATAANAGQPTYQWKVNGQPAGSNQASFSSSSLKNGDKVTVEVKSSLQCAVVSTANSNEIVAVVKERPPYLLNLGYSYCPDAEEGVSLDAGTAASYDWQPDGFNTQKVLLTEGGHIVTITFDNGCKHIKNIQVNTVCAMAIFVPDAFTPNGDNVNEAFKLFGRYVKALDFRLYNRWGELIFQTDSLDGTWDGTYRGQAVPPGAYFWYLKAEANDPSQPAVNLKGELNVIK